MSDDGTCNPISPKRNRTLLRARSPYFTIKIVQKNRFQITHNRIQPYLHRCSIKCSLLLPCLFQTLKNGNKARNYGNLELERNFFFCCYWCSGFAKKKKWFKYLSTENLLTNYIILDGTIWSHWYMTAFDLQKWQFGLILPKAMQTLRNTW